MTQATCLDCSLPYSEFPLDVVLPRAQWLAIHPDEHGLLCAACIVKRAAKIPHCTVAHMVLEIAPSALAGIASPQTETLKLIEELRQAHKACPTCSGDGDTCLLKRAADALSALAGIACPVCDCGRPLTMCSSCAVEDYQAAHPDCKTCCPEAAAGIVPPSEQGEAT